MVIGYISVSSSVETVSRLANAGNNVHAGMGCLNGVFLQLHEDLDSTSKQGIVQLSHYYNQRLSGFCLNSGLGVGPPAVRLVPG